MGKRKARIQRKTRIEAKDIILGISLLAEAEFEKYGFTSRQKQIALRVMKGQTAEHISRKLYITVSCVRYHLNQIYERAGVENRAAFLRKLWTDMHQSQKVWRNVKEMNLEKEVCKDQFSEWESFVQ